MEDQEKGLKFYSKLKKKGPRLLLQGRLLRAAVIEKIGRRAETHDAVHPQICFKNIWLFFGSVFQIERSTR